jgi:hypothetical protein
MYHNLIKNKGFNLKLILKGARYGKVRRRKASKKDKLFTIIHILFFS